MELLKVEMNVTPASSPSPSQTGLGPISHPADLPLDVTAQTFPCFLQLPKELQILIIEHAIDAIQGSSEIAQKIIYSRKPWSWRYIPMSGQFLKSPRYSRKLYASPSVMMEKLFDLMETCRFAREGTIVWWRIKVNKELAEFPPGEERCSKKLLLEVLDEFLDELRERSRTIV